MSQLVIRVKLRFDYDKAAAITDADGTMDVTQQDINFVDIRYGNFCNLKCRMCGPTDSHQWYDDFVQHICQ